MSVLDLTSSDVQTRCFACSGPSEVVAPGLRQEATLTYPSSAEVLLQRFPLPLPSVQIVNSENRGPLIPPVVAHLSEAVRRLLEATNAIDRLCWHGWRTARPRSRRAQCNTAESEVSSWPVVAQAVAHAAKEELLQIIDPVIEAPRF